MKQCVYRSSWHTSTFQAIHNLSLKIKRSDCTYFNVVSVFICKHKLQYDSRKHTLLFCTNNSKLQVSPKWTTVFSLKVTKFSYLWKPKTGSQSKIINFNWNLYSPVSGWVSRVLLPYSSPSVNKRCQNKYRPDAHMKVTTFSGQLNDSFEKNYFF